jgi:hypothetical protein
MRNLTTKSGRQNYQICLQREGSLETCGCIRMEPQGAVFKSPSRIELMADLIIRIECTAMECRCRELVMEGIVIGCENCSGGGFEITVLFLQEVDFDFAESARHDEMAKANHLLN